MSEKFNLDLIDKTFTSYKKGQAFDGVVVLKREDGVIFNIGGKNDAFILADDFESYDQVKIGDRFGVVIINQKNEEGLIEASKSLADALKIANQNAQSIGNRAVDADAVHHAAPERVYGQCGNQSRSQWRLRKRWRHQLEFRQ